MSHDFQKIDQRIANYNDPEALITATFTQLEKDAAMIGLRLDLNDGETFDQHLDSCRGWLKEVVGNQPDALSGLFYRVDIPQLEATKVISGGLTESAIEALLVLILRREFSKVILRRGYS